LSKLPFAALSFQLRIFGWCVLQQFVYRPSTICWPDHVLLKPCETLTFLSFSLLFNTARNYSCLALSFCLFCCRNISYCEINMTGREVDYEDTPADLGNDVKRTCMRQSTQCTDLLWRHSVVFYVFQSHVTLSVIGHNNNNNNNNNTVRNMTSLYDQAMIQ